MKTDVYFRGRHHSSLSVLICCPLLTVVVFIQPISLHSGFTNFDYVRTLITIIVKCDMMYIWCIDMNRQRYPPRPLMVTTTVTSTDTDMHSRVCRWSWMVWQLWRQWILWEMGVHNGVHPWMVMDGHGNCDIHGYCDGGVCTVMSIHGWSRQWWNEPCHEWAQNLSWVTFAPCTIVYTYAHI